MSGNRVVIPASHDAADDDEVFKHNGKIRATAIRAEDAVLFAQRVFPDRLAGFTVDALADAAQSLQVDVSGGRITHDARPTDALGRSIREKQVVDVLP